jgi:hypothetical protein
MLLDRGGRASALRSHAANRSADSQDPGLPPSERFLPMSNHRAPRLQRLAVHVDPNRLAPGPTRSRYSSKALSTAPRAYCISMI